MMTQIPPDIDQQIREYLATRQYQTEADVLRDAMQALAERQGVLGDIRHGFQTLAEGQGRSLEDIDADLRRKHDIPQDA